MRVLPYSSVPTRLQTHLPWTFKLFSHIWEVSQRLGVSITGFHCSIEVLLMENAVKFPLFFGVKNAAVCVKSRISLYSVGLSREKSQDKSCKLEIALWKRSIRVQTLLTPNTRVNVCGTYPCYNCGHCLFSVQTLVPENMKRWISWACGQSKGFVTWLDPTPA